MASSEADNTYANGQRSSQHYGLGAPKKILFVHIASIAKCQSATVLEVTPGEVALPDWTAKGEFGC